MSIQILQYEFLGPIKLDEWGPPMEKVVYLILTRTKDSFNIVYVGDCEKTNEKNFFVDNPNFKCWIQKAGSEKSLYLAILPLFNSPISEREGIQHKIIQRYMPECNKGDIAEQKPNFAVRSNSNMAEKNYEEQMQKVSCPCCGSEMKVEKVLERTTLLKCNGCGLSDTRVNS